MITIGLGAYYFTTILPPQLGKIKHLKETSKIKEREILSLEEKVEALPLIEKQLKDLNLEIEGLKNRIPKYQSSLTMMMEILKYMDINGFKETELVLGEPKEAEETKEYKTVSMTIRYRTTYDQGAKLLEEISRSHNMVRAEKFTAFRCKEDEQDVKAELLLSLHYRDAKEEGIEKDQKTP